MPLLAEVSDSTAIWLAVIAAIGLGFKQWLDWLIAKDLKKSVVEAGKDTKEAVLQTSQDAAIAVDKVKTTLDEVTTKKEEKAQVLEAKIDDIAKTGKITHDLANSAMLAQKKMMADVTKAKAEATGDPGDHAVAVQAELVYQEHIAGQERSDAKELAADKVIAAAKLAAEKAAATENHL